jgi:hypothetical protein
MCLIARFIADPAGSVQIPHAGVTAHGSFETQTETIRG